MAKPLLPKNFKRFLILSVSLFAYGILCRVFQIRFFWESEIAGIALLIICAGIALLRRRQTKLEAGRNALPEGAAATFLFLCVPGAIAMLFLIHGMDAYPAAKKYLLTPQSNPEMVQEVYSIVPLPNLSRQTYGRLVEGGARDIVTFQFIVKGRSRFADVSLEVTKTDSSDWKVTGYKISN